MDATPKVVCEVATNASPPSGTSYSTSISRTLHVLGNAHVAEHDRPASSTTSVGRRMSLTP